MFRTGKKFYLILIGSACSIAMTACAPSYQTSAYEQDAYGYDQAAYGYDYVSDHSNSGYGIAQNFNTAHSSRYGDALRGPCDTFVQSCGMVAVVPVYPVYQVITYPETPEVQTVEVPTITLPDPEPLSVEIYEPEPVYEPPVYEPVTDYWPEPDDPITTWAPLRK